MADQTLAKQVNERGILTLLRQRRVASRASMARALDLTPATITRLTSSMLARGLLIEVASDADPALDRDPGRPGIAIAINPAGGYFLGVEIGVTVLRAVLLDLTARVVAREEAELPARLTPVEAARAVARLLARYASGARPAGRILSGGVTVPGLVTTAGHVVNLPILGWRHVDLGPLLAAETDVPLAIDNNASAAAFGAVYSQPGIQAPSTVFLKLGTGCGGAVIVNGRLMRGADGTGMEFGHVPVAGQGITCSCGQVGCLETFVNLAALARAYPVAELSSSDRGALPGLVAAAAERGDPAAQAAVADLSRHLATGIATLVNIFNPSQVLLGGVMRPVLDQLLPDLRTRVAHRIIPGTRLPDIGLSGLDRFECAIGAACLAHHRAFDLQNLDLTAPDPA